MVTIERMAGQGVRIGGYILKVLAVQPGRVVVALLDAETECLSCGQSLVGGRCPACQAGAAPPPTGNGPEVPEG
jgi:hypothetical protein